LDELLAELDKRIATLEDELTTVLRDGAWAESASLLSSISGIGLVMTAWLLVGTLNFTACRSAEAAAAYACLVPLARESGTSLRHVVGLGASVSQVLRRVCLPLRSRLSALRFTRIL
jgi:transposase